MTHDDNGLAEETGRAMRELASTVTDAPPLRLTARRDVPAPRPSRARRWTQWGVPLAAAIAVIALAVGLVVVRDLPADRASRPMLPSAEAAPTYYVAPETTCKGTCGRESLVVGDTFTGATLATLAPPRGTTFMTVTGAADDRTFITDTVEYPASTTGPQQATWYRITLTPGSSAPARLTRLPIPSGPATSGVQAIALSASGEELAVAYHLGPVSTAANGPGATMLRIYSVATGRLLHSWSTSQQDLFSVSPYAYGAQADNQLTWVDDDQGIAFANVPSQAYEGFGAGVGSGPVAVRVLKVAAGASDLIAASHVVWSLPVQESGQYCNALATPVLTADETAVLCTSTSDVRSGTGASEHDTQTLSWLAFKTSRLTAARVLYRAVATLPGKADGGMNLSLLWASRSGSTLIVAWTFAAVDHAATHFGVVTNGKFTSLATLPASDSYRLLAASPGIAW